MEDGVSAAIDALPRWPVGLKRFVAATEQVRAGELDVDAVWEGLGAEGDGSTAETDERDESDEDREGPSLAVREFLSRAAIVQTLASVGTDAAVDARSDPHSRALHTALVAIKLSPPFLVKLGEEAVGETSVATNDFKRSLGKYTAARERMISSNFRLMISVAYATALRLVLSGALPTLMKTAGVDFQHLAQHRKPLTKNPLVRVFYCVWCCMNIQYSCGRRD
jgi:hypothetical protein